MANYPNAPQPLSYAAPLQSFAGLDELPQKFFQGAEQRKTYDVNNAFREGLPRDPKGEVDFRAVAEKLARAGAVDQIVPLANVDMQRRLLEMGLQGDEGLLTGQPPVGRQPAPQPAPQRPAGPQPQQPQPQLSSMGTDNRGAETTRTLLTGLFGGRDISNEIPRYASALGLRNQNGVAAEDQPLTPELESRLRAIAAPRLSRPQTAQTMPSQGAPTSPSPQPQPAPGTQPQGQPQPAPSAQPTPGSTAPIRPNAVTTVPQPPLSASGQPTNPSAAILRQLGVPEGVSDVGAFVRALQIRGQKLSASPLTAAMGKADLDRAKLIMEALQPTGPMKEGAQVGHTALDYETQKDLGKELAKHEGESIGEYIKAGRAAFKRTELLDVMGDALRRGEGKMTTGPFADIALKMKQAANGAFGWEFEGLEPAQVIQKMGFSLATQTVKEITNRPTQMEVRMAFENNPGLLLSPKGSEFMIAILKQTARQDVDIAKLMQRPENRKNWIDVVDNYYNTHPVISPFTGKPVSAKDVAELQQSAGTQAPQPGQGRAPAATPSAGAVNLLKANPAYRDQFEQKYGPGSAAKYLGGG